MSKQPQLADYRQIAKNHHLKLIIEEPLQEPLLAIVNLKARTLSVVSRNAFCQEQAIRWTEDVINAPALVTLEEKTALQQANDCWKALLQTDYGFGVTNLQEIKQGNYAALYEGYFIDQKNKPTIAQLRSRDYLEASTNKTYAVEFTPTGAPTASGLISALTYRGFGGFMQHLPNEPESAAYGLSPGFKDHIVSENLSRVNLGTRVFLKAKRHIPALSPIGFSYAGYWYGKSQSPVPFDRRTGFSIPPSGYQVVRYFINFIDTQSGEEYDQDYSVAELQSLGKSDYSTVGDLIYKPEHLTRIRDAKTGKIQPPSLYSMILISNLTAHDYKTVADYYFAGHVGHDPSDVQSPKHLQQVINFYRRAQQLFLQEKKLEQSAYCRQQVKAHQQLLQQMGGAGDQEPEQEAQVLLNKYKGRDEKISAMDHSLAFRRAAACGHLDDLKQLLLLGAQINAPGAGSGKTALHQAVLGNHFDVFVFLMSAGANMSIKDQYQKTAINYLKIGSPLYQALSLSLKENANFSKHTNPPRRSR
jgi:hypothetical protein